MRINPLYIDYEKIDSARGKNGLYLDTQVVNYLRKKNSKEVIDLKQLITKWPPAYKLYYSASHLGDYLKDPTDHKNDDLRFMGDIGMVNYIAYDGRKFMSRLHLRHPLDAFYNGRHTKQQFSQEYNEVRKPRAHNQLLVLYNWFKETLIEYEKDKSYLSHLETKNAETFLALLEEINLSSWELNEESFIENSDKYWRNKIQTMSDKEASRSFLNLSLMSLNLVKYKNEEFDLCEANVINQIKDSEFKRNFQYVIEQIMYGMGLNFSDNYDEASLFLHSYGYMQLLGVEPDKAKKFSMRSTVEDAGHCYFASMCNYLITEDDGLYRRSKILYGVLGITTKVFRMNEFLEYVKKNNDR